MTERSTAARTSTSTRSGWAESRPSPPGWAGQARRGLRQRVVLAPGDQLLLQQPRPQRREAHPEVPLQLHRQGRARQLAEDGQLGDHPPQLVARDQELAGERVREPLPATIAARHADHRVPVLRVAAGVRNHMRQRERLPPRGHLRVHRDAEARLRVVVEDPVQVPAERQPPGEHEPAEHPERVAERPAAQVEMAAQLTGRPCGLPRPRGAGRRQRAAARPSQRRTHLPGQLNVVTQPLLEDPQPRPRPFAKLARGGS